jgi:hypothetical protein
VEINEQQLAEVIPVLVLHGSKPVMFNFCGHNLGKYTEILKDGFAIEYYRVKSLLCFF